HTRFSRDWSSDVCSSDLIFCETRPATIIRSAWRGVADARSIPNLARSCLGPPVAISSIAQQARPNVAGQTEFFRAHPTAFSTVRSGERRVGEIRKYGQLQ